MSLRRFLSYPVFYDPESPRAVGYVMDHFYAIRSVTRFRRILKLLGRPAVPLFRRRGKEDIIDHPRFESLRPYLDSGDVEVVVDARRFFRVIRFARNQVINIFKGDDLELYFNNEIEARRRLSGRDFLPALIGVDEEKKVFIEEYVCRRPFKSNSPRGLDPVDFAGRVREIIREIRSAATVRVVSREEYVAGLTEVLLNRPETDGDIRRYIRRLAGDAVDRETVELVYSHGDFRKDQLFFGPAGELKVIDWENSGYFSRCRDPLEFFLSEVWLYRKPAVSPEWFLDIERSQLRGDCALYLLELAHFPVRFRRNFLLTRSVPLIQKLERRIRRKLSR